MRRSIVYCTSAVSDIHKICNFVDSYIEKAWRVGYVNLANRIITEARADRTLTNGVIAIFKNPFTQARTEINMSIRPAEQPENGRMI